MAANTHDWTRTACHGGQPGVVCRCWVLLVVLGGIFSAGGCSGFTDKRKAIEEAFHAGRYEHAVALLDDKETLSQYGRKNRVLWQLERGTAALATHDLDGAFTYLERAEESVDQAREASLSDVAGRWLINDRSAAYITEPYEDMYVNVFKTVAHLEAGRIQGGATVEVRRLARKSDMLRDAYLQYEEQMRSKGGSSLRALERQAPLKNVNSSGEYIESPLGTYLTAVTYMKTGQSGFQSVAGRRLIEAIELQQGLVGGVSTEPFSRIGEMEASKANVLVVAFSGRGPTKYAERYGPLLIGSIPIYFELPRIKRHVSDVVSARLEFRDGSSWPLDLVEDLGAVAAENHQRQLPLIQTRTLLRYAVKAGVAAALAEGMYQSSNEPEVHLAAGLTSLAALLYVYQTEKADLRCWLTLPGQAHVGLAKAPVGTHEGRVVYLSSNGGTVHTSPWTEFEIRRPDDDAELHTIVTHYWR